MNCPACAHENRPGAKFCEECAAPLQRSCASCGSELRPGAKFCDECGASLGAAAAPRPTERSDARKIVTIVFADLVGSTALHERLDPESARQFMEGYYAAMRGAVESHGGSVTQLLGDGVKAVFGIPRVAEDDAIRAVRAAVAMQVSFRALAEQQRGAVGKTGLRVAVNTGEVVARDASEIIGDPVNVAARLQELGRDGDVVVGDATQRLVSGLVTLEPLGSFALKGRSEAVNAHRVVSLERPAGAAATAFVGRDDELARIRAVYDTAVAKPATALAVLLGSPGLGKSRLIDEFARRLGDGATLIQAHCDAAGGASFAPLADALRALPELDAVVPGGDAERARILDGIRALLAGTPGSPEETFFVVRRLLSALAATQPVVLVIDDVHWAEPLLLDLIEHLVQWGSGVPLLVLVGARPELREVRSTLVSPGGLVAEVVTLAGLDAGAAMRLAANVIGASDLPASVAAKVLATSEGNPLFVGELVRMLVHEGALKRDGERWTAGTALAALEMPPTIHALLAARIERLRPEERSVLERAAVIGRSFSRSAVAELLARDVVELDARLESLRRAELIERDAGWFLGEPVLRFHHVLIRDAAYRRILKGTRAELHARFADWVEARAGDSLEHDETIGWHLEQAHQHLRELGPIDARGRALGERAAARLSAAGRRALARDDVPLAAGLLGRALDRLDRDDPARAELALDWCEALLAAGDVGPATAALEELERFATSDARLRAWHTCFAGQLTVLAAPSGLNEAAESVAAAARQLAELGDVAGEAKAHFVHAQAFQRLGKVGACEAALDRALAAARRAGDRRRANTVLAVAPLAALWGPSPVTRASGRCLDVVRVLRITQGAPAVEAVALSCQGVLEALRGRTDAARRMIASARKMVEELGITQRLLEADVFAARIDLLDGDATAAERGLRAAYEGMRELGLGIDAARAAALLARALLQLDRADEAEALTHQSEQLAGDDLQAAIAWRGARAEALARRGETVEAVALATRAVEIAGATDALLDHADARLALAAALRAAGRNAEGDSEERRATELWEAKGATLLAERARRDGSPTAPAAAPPAARVEPSRLRARANAATAGGPRIEAAVAARDVAALERLFADPCVVVHHPTGATYGRSEQLKTWKSLLRAEHLSFQRDVLATLGDSLALVRHGFSLSGFAEERLKSSGPVDLLEFVLYEADARGEYRRFEIFAADRLDQAITRTYERHAELLRDDRERTRAQAIAHTARVMLGQPDLAATATVLAPDIEFSDLRTVGIGTLRGAEAVLQTLATMMDLSRDDSARIDDVVVLEPDALVVRWTNRGTHVESGGTFERNLCQLFAFGPTGLLSRWQQFEPEHDAEARARVDALSAGVAAPRSPRPLRANAATRNAELGWAAANARDAEALAATHSERLEVIHHPTGATYGASEVLATNRAMWRTRSPTLEQEALATLGESLALVRRSYRHDGSDSSFGSVGAAEGDYFVLYEVDERGLFRRSEVFAGDRFGDAVARLYERYAELLPAGPERERAVASARSLGTLLLAPGDPDRIAAAFAPDIEIVDHRPLRSWTLRGVEAFLAHRRALLEVADDISLRAEAVLALEANALLVRVLHSGTERLGGGAWERPFLMLVVTGADGRIARNEQFAADREAEALARFDALVGGDEAPSAAERFANAASRADRELLRCFGARDWPGVLACVAPELVFDERRRMLRNTCGREVWLEQFRLMFDVPASRFTSELRATRGERLSLNLHRFEGEVAGGGGPLAMDDHFALHEVDRDGRIVAIVLFDQDDLDAAHAELDARFAAGEAAAHPLTVGAWLETRRAHDAHDWAAYHVAFARDFVCYDHRVLGWGTLHGVDAFVGMRQSLFELAPDSRWRNDHILIGPRGHLQASLLFGSRDGGAFELELFRVTEIDARGKIIRVDIYDTDRLDHATSRFDELKAATPLYPFANAASRLVEQGVGRLWAARDWDGIVATISPAMRMDDRRRIMRLEIGYEEFLAQFRMLFDQPGSGWRESLLATRGERLSLHRTRFEAEVAQGGGPLAFDDHLSVTELDADGRWIASVTFDLDALDAAYAELDRRYEAGEDQAHAVHATIMRAFTRSIETRDWDPVLALCAPALVEHDHRPLAVLGTTRGAEAWVQNFRVLAELAPDSRYRVDHFRSSARGFCTVGVWVGAREGGPYELPLVAVLELDAHKRIARADIFDGDQLRLARARFDELHALAARRRRFESTATRAFDEVMSCLRARDWDRYTRLLSSEFRYSDRQPMVQLELDRERYLEFVRPLHAMSTTPGDAEVLATRGDRLLLGRRRVTLSDSEIGPSELEHLNVLEVDARGRLIALVRFDAIALDAAYAELDERYDSGEGAAHSRELASLRAENRAWANRDWDAFLTLAAPEFAFRDHRLLGWGATMSDVSSMVRILKALTDLAPDTRSRLDHIRVGAHASVRQLSQLGSRDGGAFENVFLLVAELDEHGRLRANDAYDVDQSELALAHFARLTALAASRFENAATRVVARATAAQGARDWERFGSFFAPEFRNFDRRAMIQLETDREQFLVGHRQIIEMTTSPVTHPVLATRGDRLAIVQLHWQGAADDIGPSEIDWLIVIEVDGRGDHIAAITFDPGDLDAAYAELDARFEAGEGALHPRAMAALRARQRALEDRDWEAFAAGLSSELVCHDHRLLGWGTLHGVAAFVRTQQTLVELAPDSRWRNNHEVTAERGHLLSSLLFGTRDGGPFELEFVRVVELDAHDQVCRIDIYDPDQVDAARARFDELRAPAPGRSLVGHAKPNAASAAMNRWRDSFDALYAADDWAPMRALCTPAMVFDDRRRLALIFGDRELMIASARERVAMGARPEMATIGTAGDRVAIQRVLWTGGPREGRFEIEYLAVVEIDASGLLSAFVFFDVDAARAAQREAWARWAAIDAVAAPYVELLEGISAAWNSHDRARLRARFADDLVVEDHRRSGLGRIDGAEAYVDSNVVLWELAPDQRIEFGSSWPAVDRHAALVTLRRHGTLADGGAFENDYLWLSVVQDGRVTRLELFESDAADAALARFEALRPDPLRVPPNAASRAIDHVWRLAASGDAALVRTLVADDFCFYDRGRMALLQGDVEAWQRSLQFLATEAHGRIETRLLATAGERLALLHVRWREAPGEGRFEIDGLRLAEVDAAGRFRAVVRFDVEQRATASDELFERFVASGADGIPSAAIEYLRSFNAHDLARLRAALHRDFVFHDHRRVGAGRLEGADAYVPFVAAGYELTRDLRSDVEYIAAAAPHGLVVLTRATGTNTEGGAFESCYVALLRHRDGKVVRSEFFEPEDLERALARLEELRPDARRSQPNAASSASDRAALALAAGDRAALRALASADFRFEDRGRRALVVGDVETWLDSVSFLAAEQRARLEPELLATFGDRVAVYRDAWSGSSGGGAFELGGIRVFEVDADGRLRALLLFDSEDRDAAFAEAITRLARGEAAGSESVMAFAAFLRAQNERAWDVVRERLTPDLVVTDHRPLGLGVLDRESWVASLEATVTLSVGARFEGHRVLAWNERGIVSVIRRHGSIRDGGGPFENFTVVLAQSVGDRIARLELFEEADVERALARFEELCAET